MHEDDPHEYPPYVILGIWEELNWRWWEELKMELRSLLRDMDTEAPTKSELKFYALSPDEHGRPRFRFPVVFDLDGPGEYYQSVIKARVDRRLKRTMWSLVYKPPKPGKASLKTGALDDKQQPPPKAPTDDKQPPASKSSSKAADKEESWR